MKNTRILGRLRYFNLVYFLFLAGAGITLLAVSKKDLYYWLNGFHSAAANEVFAIITLLGHGLVNVVVALLLTIRSYGYSILLLVSFLMVSGVVQLFKKVLLSGMMRPVKYFERDPVLNWIDGITYHSYQTFPSGHAATVFSLAAGLSLIAGQKKWGVLFAALAILTAYSRVYLGQHFPVDIVAGSLTGVGITLLVFLWLEKKMKQSGLLDRGLFKK